MPVVRQRRWWFELTSAVACPGAADAQGLPTWWPCERRGDRFDVVGWQTPEEFERRAAVRRVEERRTVVVGAAAVLVDAEPFFEYPAEANQLWLGCTAPASSTRRSWSWSPSSPPPTP